MPGDLCAHSAPASWDPAASPDPASMSHSSSLGSGSPECFCNSSPPEVEFPQLLPGRGAGIFYLYSVLGGIGAAQFPQGQWSEMAGLEVVPLSLSDH